MEWKGALKSIKFNFEEFGINGLHEDDIEWMIEEIEFLRKIIMDSGLEIN